MKKMILILLSILILTSCNSKSNSTFDRAMEEGKFAVAEDNYEKAEKMFSMALNEKNNDKEANSLYIQIKDLIAANALVKENKLEEAKNIYNKIQEAESKSDIIRKEAKMLTQNIAKASNSEIINEEKTAGDLVLDYNVYQSTEHMEGKFFRDSDGEIALIESDYSMYEPLTEGERLVTTYVPESSVNFSLKNIGNETIVNPIINFKFVDMAIEFESSERWQGIDHNRGIGTWNEVRWSPPAGTTIQPGVPIDFRFAFENSSIYSNNAKIEVILSGDNFKAKTFQIPVRLKQN